MTNKKIVVFIISIFIIISISTTSNAVVGLNISNPLKRITRVSNVIKNITKNIDAEKVYNTVSNIANNTIKGVAEAAEIISGEDTLSNLTNKLDGTTLFGLFGQVGTTLISTAIRPVTILSTDVDTNKIPKDCSGCSLTQIKKYTNSRYEKYIKYSALETGGTIQGQCTWWVYCRASEFLGIPYLNIGAPGLARFWDDLDQMHEKDKKAKANSILVIENGSITGHAVYVERVVGNKLYISEANSGKYGSKRYGAREITMQEVKNEGSYMFIHLD